MNTGLKLKLATGCNRFLRVLETAGIAASRQLNNLFLSPRQLTYSCRSVWVLLSTDLAILSDKVLQAYNSEIEITHSHYTSTFVLRSVKIVILKKKLPKQAGCFVRREHCLVKKSTPVGMFVDSSAPPKTLGADSRPFISTSGYHTVVEKCPAVLGGVLCSYLHIRSVFYNNM